MQIDQSHFPIVVIRIGTTVDLPGVEALQKDLRALFGRRQRFACICDLRGTQIPDATVRRAIATMHEAIAEEQKRWNVGNANIMQSTAMRGAFTAVTWLFTPPTPQAYVANMAEGVAWCLTKLEAAGIEVPADVQRTLSSIR